MKNLIAEYKKKKHQIKNRLREFKNINKGSGKEIFAELCFCLLTPQSNARHCDKAIQELKNKDLLFKGCARAIRSVLKGKSRFHNKKAGYIVNARQIFDKNIFDIKDVKRIRENLVMSIKGIGYKEASHFLRNVGLGRDIAILDRHILKNLKNYGVIDKIPDSFVRASYLNIEDKARKFAKKVRIPLEELDLLFWSKETGEIFK